MEFFVCLMNKLLLKLLYFEKNIRTHGKKKNNVPPYTKVIHRTHWRQVYVYIQNERHPEGGQRNLTLLKFIT